MSISPKIVSPASQGTLQAQGPRDCPGWTQHPQLQVFAFLWPRASLCLGQVHTRFTHHLPHLANICCALFITIRGKLVLFPLKRSFFYNFSASFRPPAFIWRWELWSLSPHCFLSAVCIKFGLGKVTALCWV